MSAPRAAASPLALLLACAPAAAQLTPYVVTELAQLADPAGAAGDALGWSAALDDGALVLGAPGDDPGGSALVFRGAGHEWELDAHLQAPGGRVGDAFGAAVGLSGDAALVGAPGTGAAGAAWVFVPGPSGWEVQAPLAAPGAAAGDDFGAAVALAGDTAAVGAPGRDAPGAADAGAVYVFARSGAAWSLQALLVATGAGPGDAFGSALALQGDTLLVGGPQAAAGGPGAAWVFVRSGTTWSEQARLAASDAAPGDAFGASVALSGDTALVGAAGDDHPGGVDAGAAFVFARAAGTWSEQARLTASGGGAGDAFGASVSVSGGLALVGAPGDTLPAGAQAGSAHVFVQLGTFWSQHAVVTSSAAAPQAAFGRAACVAGETLLLGAPAADPSAHARGEARLYRFGLPGTWLDLGAGLAGGAGVPLLYGTGELLPRTNVSLVLEQASPSAAASLVVGLSLLAAPFKGGTLVPGVDLVLPALTDAAGGVVLHGRWPDGVPSGTGTWFQWWIADPAGPAGWAASNAVVATAP
jgi:hypothetical protein